MVVNVEIDKCENRKHFKIKWNELLGADLSEYISKTNVLLNSAF